MSTLESAACAEVSTSAEVLGSADIALPRTAAARVRFLDALRLFATFQMLQGHTVAALLSPAYRSGVGYLLWSRARGLTSVCFLFAAGMAFYLTGARAFAAGRVSSSSKRVRRALFLIVLGYALHAPLRYWLASDASALRELMAVDVLQCIGVTLLMLEATLIISSTRARWLTLIAALWALTLFASALPWHLPHTPLAAYFGSQLGSQFPLLPWSSHAFAGVLCGALALDDRARAPQRLAAAALMMLASAAIVKLGTGSSLLFDHMARCGGVIGLCSALAWLMTRPDVRPWPPTLQRLAGESLFMYVFHVVLVYGGQVGLSTLIGPRLDPAAAMSAAALVVFASCAAALAWPALASRLPERARWLAGASRTR